MPKNRTIRAVPEPRYVRRAQQDSKGRDIAKMLDGSSTDFNFMGEWVENNEYHPNDIVIDPSDGNQYRCDVAINGSLYPPSRDLEHWDLFLKGSALVSHIVIDPETAEAGVFTEEQYELLISSTLNYISRKGEIYRLFDISNNSYLSYTHVSIDTSQADKPAMLKVIRVNLETRAWELIEYKFTNAQVLTAPWITKVEE